MKRNMPSIYKTATALIVAALLIALTGCSIHEQGTEALAIMKEGENGRASILFYVTDNGLYAHDLQTSMTALIDADSDISDEMYPLSVSPNGKHIAYAAGKSLRVGGVDWITGSRETEFVSTQVSTIILGKDQAENQAKDAQMGYSWTEGRMSYTWVDNDRLIYSQGSMIGLFDVVSGNSANTFEKTSMSVYVDERMYYENLTAATDGLVYAERYSVYRDEQGEYKKTPLEIVQLDTNLMFAENGSTAENQNVAKDQGTAENQNAAKDQGTSENQNVAKDQGTSENQNIAKDQDTTENQNAAKDQDTAENQNIVKSQDTVISYNVIKGQNTVIGQNVAKGQNTVISQNVAKDQNTVISQNVAKDQNTEVNQYKEKNKKTEGQWQKVLLSGTAPTEKDMGKTYMIAGISKDKTKLYVWPHTVSASMVADGTGELIIYDIANGENDPDATNYIKLLKMPKSKDYEGGMLMYQDNVAPNPVDSNYIALNTGYGREMWTNKQIHIFNINGVEPKCVDAGCEVTMTPAWSQDGTLLAYSGGKDEYTIYMEWISGGTRPSPDGTDNFMEQIMARSIYTFNTETEEVNRLTFKENVCDFAPQFIGNGRDIIFARWDEKQKNLSLIALLQESEAAPPQTANPGATTPETENLGAASQETANLETANSEAKNPGAANFKEHVIIQGLKYPMRDIMESQQGSMFGFYGHIEFAPYFAAY